VPAAECTIHLGFPVVPELYKIYTGWLGGNSSYSLGVESWSALDEDSIAILKKSRKFVTNFNVRTTGLETRRKNIRLIPLCESR
jgi:hypothetical protein